MTPTEIRHTIHDALKRIAPEVDMATIDPAVPLRDEIDLDSMDFLNFVQALHARLGIEIPETDYARLATLDGAITYLTDRLAVSPR